MGAESPWQGKILRVNLTTGEIKREKTDPEVLRKYIGGHGIGVKMLWDEVPVDTDWRSPENKIFFTAGPFNGTKVPGSGIYNVTTKAAHTGGITASQANGFFGARMRQTGNDIIVIEGVSPEWVYLVIEGDKVELRPADGLVGKKMKETQDAIQEITGQKRTSVACIGPAGEHLVSFASIGNDYGHVVSSKGCGAVMGSKKLKAIGIYAPSTDVPMVDKQALNDLFPVFEEAAAKSGLGGAIKAFGTYAYFDIMAPTGGVPIKNFTTNVWDDIEKWYGANFYAQVDRKKKPCWACPWGHCAEVTFKDGAKAGIEMEELEYEMMAAFSTNIGNHDLSVSTWLGNVMEDYGVDGKETAWSLALVYELFSKGLLTKADTGGLSFNWGETDDVPAFLEQVATRTGFGGTFSDGVKVGSERLGSEAADAAVWAGAGCASNVIDSRGIGFWSTQLALGVSDTGTFYGGDTPDPHLGLDAETYNPLDPEAVGRRTRRGSVSWVYNDCVGTCMFFLSGNQENMCKALQHIAGWDFTPAELFEVGDRTRALSRAYNLLSGGRKPGDEGVSERMKMNQVDGPGKGPDLEGAWPVMRKAYLEASEYDLETGKPLPDLLDRLGLDDVKAALWK
ncbi:MAG: aldehyde ferredoxin oxidoreductase N-terminal domain-containing protein [Coriobacteriia bacterium]